MICPNCKQAVPDSAKVCGYCGVRIRIAEPEPLPSPSSFHREERVPKPEIVEEVSQKTRKKRLGLIPVIFFGVILFVVLSWFATNLIGSLRTRNNAAPIPTTAPTLMVREPTQTKAPTATKVDYPETIVVEAYVEEEGIIRLSGLVEETSAGEFRGSFPYNIPVSFGVRTCSPTNEELINNILGIRYWNWYIDLKDVTPDMTRETIITDENACLYLRGIIRSWPLGNHAIRFAFKDNEGEGEWIYMVEITAE